MPQSSFARVTSSLILLADTCSKLLSTYILYVVARYAQQAKKPWNWLKRLRASPNVSLSRGCGVLEVLNHAILRSASLGLSKAVQAMQQRVIDAKRATGTEPRTERYYV